MDENKSDYWKFDCLIALKLFELIDPSSKKFYLYCIIILVCCCFTEKN